MLACPSRRLLTSVPVSTSPHSRRSSTSYSWKARRLRQTSLSPSPCFRAIGRTPVRLHHSGTGAGGEQEVTGASARLGRLPPFAQPVALPHGEVAELLPPARWPHDLPPLRLPGRPQPEQQPPLA